MSNEGISLFECLPLRHSVSVDILNRKTVSKVIRNNANGFFHTCEKITLPKTSTNINSFSKDEIIHFNAVFQTQL